MIVSAWNPSTEELEKTNLSAVVQIGATSLSVKNSDRLPENSLLMVGEMAMEQTELLKVGPYTITPTTRVNLVAATKFAHVADEPVYKMRYDKILFYRSATADGTYSLISTQDVDVDNSDGKTYYEDLTGTGTSFYKTKFYNSVTFEETEFSDYISAEGYGEKSIGSVIEKVVRKVKDEGYTVLSSEDYLDIATEVNDDISSQSERPYDFMRKSALLNRTAGQDYLTLPQNYFKFYQLEYTNTVGGVPRRSGLDPISLEKFNTGYGAVATSDSISRIALDEENRKILIKPKPRTTSVGAFRLWFYEDLAEFTDLSQQVKTPNTLIYRYKFLAEYYTAKSERDPAFGRLGERYEQKYGNELMKLQRSNRKDVGTPRSFMDADRSSSVASPYRRRYTL